MEKSGEKNAYYCEVCRGYIVTVNLDDGVTPSGLACRVKGEPGVEGNDCDGRMTSLFYPEQPWPEKDGYNTPIPTEPTHEWYKPGPDEYHKASAEMKQHVDKGGLQLRDIRVAA